MKLRNVLLALLLALGGSSVQVFAQGTPRATLDECTVVAVEMVDTVSSEDAHAGDFFRFQTVNAVSIANRIVIPARTMGYGLVSIANAAGRGGRPGSLVLEPRYLVLPGRRRLGVVLNHNTENLNQSGSTGNAPGYLGAIPVPGVGAAVGVFNYFHKGKNIKIERGAIFTIFPSEDPSVEACQDHPSY